VTFIPHSVTFIRSVTNTPDILVFLQDLIYIAGVVLSIPIVSYVPEASLQRVTSFMCNFMQAVLIIITKSLEILLQV
jgi:hypothetical protein